MTNIWGVIALSGFFFCALLYYTSRMPDTTVSSNAIIRGNFSESPKESYPDKSLIDKLQRAFKSKKVILKWYSRGIKSRNLSWRCGSCEVITNKAKIDDPNVSVVLMLYNDVKPEGIPVQSKRRQDQLYVWVAQESPPNLLFHKKINLVLLDQIGFNATATYRRDSDFSMPYEIAWGQLQMKKPPNKTKLAVAVVSDCHATAGARARLKYLKEFQKHFPLDGYGKCFGNRLSKEAALNTTMQYKFYFAFENSYHCRDYITEKLTNHALKSQSVPVVWGATKEDYESRIPPGSFIFVEDYQPMEKLINYLHYLDKNDTAYLEYFRWRESPARSQSEKIFMCDLCRKINGISRHENFNETNQKPKFSTRQWTIGRWLLGDNVECFRENIIIK